MAERLYRPRQDRGDLHHALFPRRYHRETYDQAAYLASIIVVPNMWRPIHEELHSTVAPVPALGYYSLCSVARDIHPKYDDPIKAVNHYCSLVEDAANHPKAKPREADLNLLHVDTLREQIPFIRDAMKHNRRQL